MMEATEEENRPEPKRHSHEIRNIIEALKKMLDEYPHLVEEFEDDTMEQHKCAPDEHADIWKELDDQEIIPKELQES